MSDVMAFLDRLNGNRDTIKRLGEDIAQALRRQAAIRSTPPHTADIVEAFRARVDALASAFEAHVLSYPAPPATGHDEAYLGSAMIAYFARDMITGKLPLVVERMRPESKTGMTPEHRSSALAEVGTELANLWRARDEARQAIGAQMIEMRDLRQDAMWRRDAMAQGAIESMQLDLAPEMEVLRGDQERLYAAAMVRG